jgi:hypothetical protein
MKVGDLVRTKAPFSPEICLVVGIREDVGDECYEVLAARGKFTTYNLRKDSLEVINESR